MKNIIEKFNINLEVSSEIIGESLLSSPLLMSREISNQLSEILLDYEEYNIALDKLVLNIGEIPYEIFEQQFYCRLGKLLNEKLAIIINDKLLVGDISTSLSYEYLSEKRNPLLNRVIKNLPSNLAFEVHSMAKIEAVNNQKQDNILTSSLAYSFFNKGKLQQYLFTTNNNKLTESLYALFLMDQNRIPNVPKIGKGALILSALIWLSSNSSDYLPKPESTLLLQIEQDIKQGHLPLTLLITFFQNRNGGRVFCDWQYALWQIDIIKNHLGTKITSKEHHLLEKIILQPVNASDRSSVLISDEKLTIPLTITGAGLVLLWPLLTSLFSSFDLLNKKNFSDNLAQEIAFNLLEWLVWGDEMLLHQESSLSLLLCGIDHQTIPERQVLIPEHKEKLNSWVQGICTQLFSWKKLGIDDIRQLFLQRQATLYYADDGRWLLTVQREAYDVLLTQIPWPWPLNIVTLPWLAEPISITWEDISEPTDLSFW
ncbi:contractile injection system tape measure protein [Photorhabdus australis]|uniref:contractile injection system tape measure protein n=1 Tax=Photorhabdus australis TaxID=286156 RepID=UPI00056A96B6|nr:contractile injection system tape measure protein [Photorhabdus australis]